MRCSCSCPDLSARRKAILIPRWGTGDPPITALRRVVIEKRRLAPLGVIGESKTGLTRGERNAPLRRPNLHERVRTRMEGGQPAGRRLVALCVAHDRARATNLARERTCFQGLSVSRRGDSKPRTHHYFLRPEAQSPRATSSSLVCGEPRLGRLQAPCTHAVGEWAIETCRSQLIGCVESPGRRVGLCASWMTGRRFAWK